MTMVKSKNLSLKGVGDWAGATAHFFKGGSVTLKY